MYFPVFSKAKVLVVDDEASNVRLLERILELSKVGAVCSTTDSRRALPLFLEEQPDIVLLDLHMPHVDGFTILSRIQAALAADEYLPVIILTADITPETRQRALSQGAQDFLTKPFDHLEVLMRIRNLLENRMLHKELKLQNASLETLVKRRTSELEETLGRLRATQQQLIKQERLRALGMMASGIAHDFNNALTLVLGYGELLTPFFQNLPEEREKLFLANLMAAAQDAAHVVSRLREFYRPTVLGEVRERVDVNATIEQSLILTAPRWRDKCRAEGRQIETELSFGELPPLVSNAAELREVLTNLIFNSVDAMPKGGRIYFRTRAMDGRVEITVQDTGIGMTSEECARCLEPFYTTKGEQGTGLGLASVYGFVQRHGGGIRIQSEKGKGATFILTLPAGEGGKTVEPEPEGRLGHVLRILVVDDQDIIRDLMTEMLSSEGHIAHSVVGAADALVELDRAPYDVIISDLSMPDMTGTQLAAEIRSRGRSIPFILLTGFGDEMKAQGAPPPEVDLVLGKPLTISTLRAALLSVARP
jgi:signal transduction histidine kinase